VPDEALHEFFNEMMRGVGTQLLGRRMYETMQVWEAEPSFFEESPVLADFAAAWQDSEKIVHSATLTEPLTTRTTIVREFDPEAVRALKDTSSADLLVSGPMLAAQALHAGLVDEVQLVIAPVAVRSGQAGVADGPAARPRAHRRASLRQRGRAPFVPRPSLTGSARERQPSRGSYFVIEGEY